MITFLKFVQKTIYFYSLQLSSHIFYRKITTKNRLKIYVHFKLIGHKYIEISWNWNSMDNNENQSCIWSFKWKHKIYNILMMKLFVILLHVYTPCTLYATIGDFKQGSMGQTHTNRSQKRCCKFLKFSNYNIYVFILTI